MSKWLDFSEIYLCPYCGSHRKLKEYKIIQNQDGKIRHILCPTCNEKMRKATLMCNITPYEWGEWLYSSIRMYNTHFYKFHDKVHMGLIVDNLKLHPEMSNDFWDGWFYAKNEWKNGRVSRLLLEIENKMYPKKVKIKLEKFFENKSLNIQGQDQIKGE